MLTSIARTFFKDPISIYKSYPRLSRRCINLSGTEGGDTFLFQTLSDVISFIIIAENPDVIDIAATIFLAIDCNIDAVSSRIIYPLINITVTDIITNSTKFHKSPLYRTGSKTADKTLRHEKIYNDERNTGDDHSSHYDAPLCHQSITEYHQSYRNSP